MQNKLIVHTRVQRGSALLVAIVMIFILSLMGVSAMRGATLEKRMAVNAVQTSATFQAAESASDLALNKTSYLNAAYQNGLNNELALDIDEVNTTVGMQSESTLEYVGKLGLIDGWSAGVGTQAFTGLVYVSRGVTAIPAVRSQATVEQGAYRIVPQ